MQAQMQVRSSTWHVHGKDAVPAPVHHLLVHWLSHFLYRHHNHQLQSREGRVFTLIIAGSQKVTRPGVQASI